MGGGGSDEECNNHTRETSYVKMCHIILCDKLHAQGILWSPERKPRFGKEGFYVKEEST